MKWLETAFKDYDLKEIVGSVDNPRIVKMHSHTSLHATDDETPWCASAVCCWLEESGLPSTKSAAAKSFKTYGKALVEPQFGCIVVFKRTGGHHVGFYLGEQGKYILLLGGNQGNKVSVGYYLKADVLAYRWPVT